MGKKIAVAYEPDHECKEGCACDTGYVDAVRAALADLGSSDPEGDIARHARYLRGARKAGLEPAGAAAMILAMSQKDPASYTPRYRYEDASEPAEAYEYVAVDTRGNRVWGPGKDYQEAKRAADRAGGVVKFYVAEAGEPRKRDVGNFTWDDAGLGSGPGVGRWIGTSPRAPQHVYEAHHESNGRWSLWKWNRYHVGGWSPEKTPMTRIGDYETLHEAKRAAAVDAGAIAGETDRESIARRANALGDGRGYPHLTASSQLPELRAWLDRADSWSLQAGLVKTTEDAWGAIDDELDPSASAASDFDSYLDALRAAKKKGWSYVALDAPPNKRAMLFTERQGNTTKDRVLAVEMFEKDGRWHIGSASHQTSMDAVPPDAYKIDEVIEGKTAKASEAQDKFERCVQAVKRDSPDVRSPWAVCHASLGREPEPFRYKHVPWHRDGAGYYADVEPYGRIRVRQRTQDKRAGKLAWYAVIHKIEVAQAESRGEVSAMVEEHLRNPGVESAVEEAPSGPAISRVSAVVERDPKAVRAGVQLDSPADVARVMRQYQARSGYEAIYLVAASKQGEMIGSPVELARGQVDSVRIAVDQVTVAAADRVGGGAKKVWLTHFHPSGHARASAKDKQLDKDVRQALRVALPETEYGGHVVVGSGSYAVC